MTIKDLKTILEAIGVKCNANYVNDSDEVYDIDIWSEEWFEARREEREARREERERAATHD